MTLITIDQFIQVSLNKKSAFNSNSYVKEPGFQSLYLRHGRRLINGKWYSNILDIANVEARKKGKGTFTSLIGRLRDKYPNMGIYVECVHNCRFHSKLEELGFKKVTDDPSFCWLPT